MRLPPIKRFHPRNLIIRLLTSPPFASRKIENRIYCLTFPRSGHGLLTSILATYFKDSFRYCEIYGHCRRTPCSSADTNFQKNHDFKLEVPNEISNCYIIQYRQPFECLVSWFLYGLRHRYLHDTKDCWEDFALRKLEFWKKFIHKWVIDNSNPHSYKLPFHEMMMNQERILSEVIKFVSPNYRLNRVLLKQILALHNIRPRKDIRNFRYYDASFFSYLESKVDSEMDSLKLHSAVKQSVLAED